MNIYNILEVANTHGGSIEYMYSLIKEFSTFKNVGIKFQPFKYNEIALEDYDYYNLYKQLYFTPKQWSDIIRTASETKEIWLDIFDTYSVFIIKENIDVIKGIKLQSSIVYNQEVVTYLQKLNLDSTKIILNISSFTIEDIKKIIQIYNKITNEKNLILQIGYQDYPTKLKFSGLSKIVKLKEHFTNTLSFADHSDKESEDAVYLPTIAAMLGCNVIEKHIMHSTLETHYDYFSSLTQDTYNYYLKKLKQYKQSLNSDFISERELIYYKNSLQIPILNKEKKKGTILDVSKDLIFKRSNQKGLNLIELEDKTTNYYIINTFKKKHETLANHDLKKATIASITACRMKSSRLPKKALQKIENLPSVEYCLKSQLSFENINHVVLATSTLEEDAILQNHTYNDSIIFHQGSPENVIKRYLGIINQLKIDVFIRITADCPFVSNDILQILLKEHFSAGADYTAGKQATIGTNLEIINAAALRKIDDYFPKGEYSEYMTYYFINNPQHFKLNFVNLPKEYITSHRLTLDYEEDLVVFNKIHEYLYGNNLEITLKNILNYLNANSEVSKINKDLVLRYKTDPDLIEKLHKYTIMK